MSKQMSKIINRSKEPKTIKLKNDSTLRLSPRQKDKIETALLPSELPKGVVTKEIK